MNLPPHSFCFVGASAIVVKDVVRADLPLLTRVDHSRIDRPKPGGRIRTLLMEAEGTEMWMVCYTRKGWKISISKEKGESEPPRMYNAVLGIGDKDIVGVKGPRHTINYSIIRKSPRRIPHEV